MLSWVLQTGAGVIGVQVGMDEFNQPIQVFRCHLDILDKYPGLDSADGKPLTASFSWSK